MCSGYLLASASTSSSRWGLENELPEDEGGNSSANSGRYLGLINARLKTPEDPRHELVRRYKDRITEQVLKGSMQVSVAEGGWQCEDNKMLSRNRTDPMFYG